MCRPARHHGWRIRLLPTSKAAEGGFSWSWLQSIGYSFYGYVFVVGDPCVNHRICNCVNRGCLILSGKIKDTLDSERSCNSWGLLIDAIQQPKKKYICQSLSNKDHDEDFHILYLLINISFMCELNELHPLQIKIFYHNNYIIIRICIYCILIKKKK